MCGNVEVSHKSRQEVFDKEVWELKAQNEILKQQLSESCLMFNGLNGADAYFGN